jgi:hypothetical protein
VGGIVDESPAGVKSGFFARFFAFIAPVPWGNDWRACRFRLSKRANTYPYKAMPESIPPPRCKALLLCEQIIIDAQSERPSLINIFDAVHAEEFPAEIGPLKIFAKVTERIGNCGFSFEIRDLQNGSSILDIPRIDVHFDDRFQLVNIVAGVNSLSIPRPGAYDLILFAASDEVERQRFEVLESNE